MTNVRARYKPPKPLSPFLQAYLNLCLYSCNLPLPRAFPSLLFAYGCFTLLSTLSSSFTFSLKSFPTSSAPGDLGFAYPTSCAPPTTARDSSPSCGTSGVGKWFLSASLILMVHQILAFFPSLPATICFSAFSNNGPGILP